MYRNSLLNLEIRKGDDENQGLQVAGLYAHLSRGPAQLAQAGIPKPHISPRREPASNLHRGNIVQATDESRSISGDDGNASLEATQFFEHNRLSIW